MALALALLAGVALCGAETGPAKGECNSTEVDWRQDISLADLSRLQGWRTAFVEALAKARAAGHETEVAREGVLLEPDAALDGPSLPAGNYRCRTVKLGSQNDGGLAFVSYPAFDCRVTVTASHIWFARLNGSQRPAGKLYAPSARRQVFLGALELGDETRVLTYGRDADRNMVGAVERIGTARWRLVLPYPRFESTLDVIELVPSS